MDVRKLCADDGIQVIKAHVTAQGGMAQKWLLRPPQALGEGNREIVYAPRKRRSLDPALLETAGEKLKKRRPGERRGKDQEGVTLRLNGRAPGGTKTPLVQTGGKLRHRCRRTTPSGESRGVAGSSSEEKKERERTDVWGF